MATTSRGMSGARSPLQEEEAPLLPDPNGDLPPEPTAGERLSRIWKDKRRVIVGAFILLVLVLGSAVTYYLVRASQLQSKQPGLVVARHGAVATELRECSGLGVEILKKGGNAMDAGIASALCIGTINSFSSGIGGGGFLIYRPANTSIPPKVVNFRESAPAKAHRNMYHGDERLAQRGGLSVSVPGEIKGYEVAHEMFGRLPWSDLFQPSIALARDGIDCPPELANRLERYGQDFRNSSDWSDFAPHGQLLRVNDRLVRETFAETLEEIAESGSKAFYEGRIAESLVSHVQAHGGVLSMGDMKAYEAIVEDPLVSTYRGHQVLTCGAPSSGPVLIEGLNILERFNMSDIGRGAAGHHYLIEAMKYLSAGRTELGDPRFLKSRDLARIEELQDKDYAARLAANISESRTYDWPHYNPKYDFGLNHGTTSLSVIDEEGNAIAITTTVNLIFGSGLLDPGTGIILNDEQDDFSIPGTSNAFGLRPSVFNYIQAQKRSMSSQTPTILTISPDPANGQDREAADTAEQGWVMSLGGSGGSRIVTALLDAIVKRLDWQYSLYDTVHAPRVHHQLLSDVVSHESTLSDDIRQGLLDRGHVLESYDLAIPRSEIQVVERVDATTVTAVSDARKRGIAVGY